VNSRGKFVMFKPVRAAYHHYGVICLKKRRPARKSRFFNLRWQDLRPGCVCATISGNSRVLVENHRGIIEFTPDRVRLAADCGEITVSGTFLSISQANGASIIVEGVISCVTMPEGGDVHA